MAYLQAWAHWEMSNSSPLWQYFVAIFCLEIRCGHSHALFLVDQHQHIWCTNFIVQVLFFEREVKQNGCIWMIVDLIVLQTSLSVKLIKSVAIVMLALCHNLIYLPCSRPTAFDSKSDYMLSDFLYNISPLLAYKCDTWYEVIGWQKSKNAP